MAQENGELSEGSLDSRPVCGLQELAENVPAVHQLVRVPTPGDLCLAQCEEIGGELTCRIVEDALEAAGGEELVKEFEEGESDPVNFLVSTEDGEQLVGKPLHIFRRHLSHLGKEAAAGIPHQSLGQTTHTYLKLRRCSFKAGFYYVVLTVRPSMSLSAYSGKRKSLTNKGKVSDSAKFITLKSHIEFK